MGKVLGKKRRKGVLFIVLSRKVRRKFFQGLSQGKNVKKIRKVQGVTKKAENTHKRVHIKR